MTYWRTTLPLLTAALLAADAAAAEGRTIRGTVIDTASKQGLPGASVSVKGTSLTAVTAPDGSFSLAGAPDGEVVLSVQAPGHVVRELTLPPGTHDARLAPPSQSMPQE